MALEAHGLSKEEFLEQACNTWAEENLDMAQVSKVKRRMTADAKKKAK
jgi:hypothetical protein